MLYEINDIVYLNGEITLNRFPRGDIGINDIKKIYLNNIKGSVFEIELPSIYNKNQFLYTIKIFENLYAIEVPSNKMSKYPISSNGIINWTNNNDLFSKTNPLANPILNPLTNSFINPTLNPLTNLNQLNQLNVQNLQNLQNQQNQIAQFNLNQMNMYKNLNTSKSVQKTITKYYYYKLIDDWLRTKLFKLLAFVEFVDNEPQLIKSMSKYSVEKVIRDSDENIDKRIKYFENNIITKKIVKQLLKKIVKNMCINWYDLNKNESTIQKVFLEYFYDLLENSINSIN